MLLLSTCSSCIDICDNQCYNVNRNYLPDAFDDELLVNDVILGLFDKLIFGCDIRLVFTGCGVSTFLAPSWRSRASSGFCTLGFGSLVVDFFSALKVLRSPFVESRTLFDASSRA